MSRTLVLAASAASFLAAACNQSSKQAPAQQAAAASYYDNSGHPDAWSGGARLIPISTPKGKFHVWIKRSGNNPRLKLLLLHGGPGATHEYFEAFDSFLPKEGVEYYYYDQLGSGFSDQPKGDDLWTIPRFVSEVDQVRQAIGGNKDNFCLLGHSWGGILAIEYALAHQDQVKCLVISNMMASIPAYNVYAKNVLEPQMDQAALKRIKAMETSGKTEDPAYMGLLIPNWYQQHILRRPVDQWPDPVNRGFGHINRHLYVLMQGPSEMGASGRLEKWDRFADLKRITVPTLVISGKYDTMDPRYMAAMARQLPRGELAATNGGHMAMYDDQATYFAKLTAFLRKFR
ncbi:proline iminopeptidase-family hydrolase [Sphingomonas segetis]|uniref:proline iminopeptidase-family hydrolase n=1 Tax=Sphingomonas segetis TaxID=1104779 RepID=UPI0012D30C98|nr:proline iminopeptidase-family hydrolase [Sphingomonas segetis]